MAPPLGSFLRHASVRGSPQVFETPPVDRPLDDDESVLDAKVRFGGVAVWRCGGVAVWRCGMVACGDVVVRRGGSVLITARVAQG
jgi:hypothetical protein